MERMLSKKDKSRIGIARYCLLALCAVVIVGYPSLAVGLCSMGQNDTVIEQTPSGQLKIMMFATGARRCQGDILEAAVHRGSSPNMNYPVNIVVENLTYQTANVDHYEITPMGCATASGAHVINITLTMSKVRSGSWPPELERVTAQGSFCVEFKTFTREGTEDLEVYGNFEEEDQMGESTPWFYARRHYYYRDSTHGTGYLSGPEAADPFDSYSGSNSVGAHYVTRYSASLDDRCKAQARLMLWEWAAVSTTAWIAVQWGTFSKYEAAAAATLTCNPATACPNSPASYGTAVGTSGAQLVSITAGPVTLSLPVNGSTSASGSTAMFQQVIKEKGDHGAGGTLQDGVGATLHLTADIKTVALDPLIIQGIDSGQQVAAWVAGRIYPTYDTLYRFEEPQNPCN